MRRREFITRLLGGCATAIAASPIARLLQSAESSGAAPHLDLAYGPDRSAIMFCFTTPGAREPNWVREAFLVDEFESSAFASPDYGLIDGTWCDPAWAQEVRRALLGKSPVASALEL